MLSKCLASSQFSNKVAFLLLVNLIFVLRVGKGWPKPIAGQEQKQGWNQVVLSPGLKPKQSSHQMHVS